MLFSLKTNQLIIIKFLSPYRILFATVQLYNKMFQFAIHQLNNVRVFVSAIKTKQVFQPEVWTRETLMRYKQFLIGHHLRKTSYITYRQALKFNSPYIFPVVFSSAGLFAYCYFYVRRYFAVLSKQTFEPEFSLNYHNGPLPVEGSAVSARELGIFSFEGFVLFWIKVLCLG